MSARRLLLIDSDDDFYRSLYEQLSSYGFEIYRVAETMEALDQIGEVEPELIFIAVEEPDKLGYSLCSRVKKSDRKDIPIILSTATVPPSGFNSHRRLSVHADEYIDKRAMNPPELAEKIDRLIGLTTPPEEEVELPNMDEFDVEVGGFDDEGDVTRIAPPNVLVQAGLIEDGAPDAELDTGSSPFTPLPDLSDELDPDFVNGDSIRTSASLPAFRGARIQTEHGNRPASNGHSPRRSESGPHPVDKSGSQQISKPLRPVPVAKVVSSSAPHRTEDPGSGIDLGLAEVAEIANEEQSSRHIQSRLQVVERENQRLRAELEKAKKSSESGAVPSFSREREFLNLREIINKKEKEILTLRDEVGVKERQILDGKEAVRQLQRDKTEIDSKNLELEQHLLGFNEQLAALESEQQTVKDRIRTLEQELDGRNQELANYKAQHSREIETLERSHAEAIEEHQKTAAQDREAALARLRDEYEQKQTALREEHQRALTQQQEQHEQAQAEALEEARNHMERELAEAGKKHEQEVAELEARHEDQIQARDDELSETMARLEQEKEEAITALESKASGELASAEEAHKLAMEQAIREADQRRHSELAEAAEKHAAERSELERAHSEAAAELAEEKRQLDAGLASLREELDKLKEELAGAMRDIEERDQALGERDRKIEERDLTIEEQRANIAENAQRIRSLEADVEELEGQNTGYQDQILKAYKKIKSDEAMVNKAKKALAVALTILDESISGLEAPGDEAR
ncbi:MAG: response regulator [Proteobacteria bacterium]|nr:response regulator [Pseudomonadota bacterium]